MKLYLIRHGQSEANSTATHSGWSQVLLTAKGEGEARAVGACLRREDLMFDRIYTSDLRRAMQTHALALPDTTARTTPLIREVNVGTLAGRLIADCTREMGEPYLAAKSRFDFRTWGGENYEMFCTRILQFVRQIEQEDGETAAAFCHGGVIHAVLDMLFSGTLNDGKPVPTEIGIDKPSFACPNCGVFVFELSKGMWKLRSWNRFDA
jgi:broad specificity phosphatase PhoE